MPKTIELVVRGDRTTREELTFDEVMEVWRLQRIKRKDPQTKTYEILGVVHCKDGLVFYKLGFTGDIETTKEYYRIEGGWAIEPSDTEPYLKFVKV